MGRPLSTAMEKVTSQGIRYRVHRAPLGGMRHNSSKVTTPSTMEIGSDTFTPAKRKRRTTPQSDTTESRRAAQKLSDQSVMQSNSSIPWSEELKQLSSKLESLQKDGLQLRAREKLTSQMMDDLVKAAPYMPIVISQEDLRQLADLGVITSNATPQEQPVLALEWHKPVIEELEDWQPVHDCEDEHDLEFEQLEQWAPSWLTECLSDNASIVGEGCMKYRASV